MKILIAALLYDYGHKERGYSWEYYNLFQSLKDMGNNIDFYDFLTEYNSKGKVEMNNELLGKIKANNYDVTIFSLYTDQFIPKVINETRKYTKTLCFFHDDTWRKDFSLFWARQFDYFTTTDIYGEERYKKLGLKNAIYFPWGCNPNIYKKLQLSKVYDVSFVGGYHPIRAWLINLLRKNKIKVDVFGTGWPYGFIDQNKMIKVFHQSKINLNLSNNSSWDIRYLLSSRKSLWNTLNSPKNTEQMKARHFEINGCGGFQLSYYVEGLEHNYEIGKEIAIYTSPANLVEKVKYYLSNDIEREQLANAGYERTLKDHTFDKRFSYAFEKMNIHYA